MVTTSTTLAALIVARPGQLLIVAARCERSTARARWRTWATAARLIGRVLRARAQAWRSRVCPRRRRWQRIAP